MKIGVLGTGDVGQVLGSGYASRGHEVKMGSRTPGSEKVTAWVAKTEGKGSAGTFAEAAAFGDVIILATLWGGTKGAIDLAGPESFAGKIVMDATNPLVFEEGKPPALALGFTDSGGEQVQRWLPDAKVVKAFNIVGNPHMVDPDFPGGPPDMFICGNDGSAKETVTGLIKEFGWPTIDLGGIECSRYLEPLAMIWITHFIRKGFNGNHAFKLLTK